MDGWYPECEECGCGNLGSVVCKTCYNEVQKDIQKMLMIIQSFTKPNTEGQDLLDKWITKYGSQNSERLRE